jgi:hypothetical protein
VGYPTLANDLVLALAIACWGVTKPSYTFRFW